MKIEQLRVKAILRGREFSLLKHIKEGNVEIGKHSYGTPIIYWDKYSKAKITIGKYCSIADEVTIFNGSNHNINWITTYPIRIMFDLPNKFSDGHPSTKGNVRIGNDVWLGHGVKILSGITIGDGAVVAGQSVVTKDIPPYTIYGGVPAKFIKKRFEDNQINALLKIKWWNWRKDEVEKSVSLLCSEKIDDFISKYG